LLLQVGTLERVALHLRVPLPDHRLHVVLEQYAPPPVLRGQVHGCCQEIADDHLRLFPFDPRIDAREELRRAVFLDGIWEARDEVSREIQVEPGRELPVHPMGNDDKFVAVFGCALFRIGSCQAVVQRQIADSRAALELPQHVVGADPPALVDGVEQLGLEPENPVQVILPRDKARR
jgi:hypothetical protein